MAYFSYRHLQALPVIMPSESEDESLEEERQQEPEEHHHDI